MSIRTPRARVRGLGSARQGVEHFWMQRITAVALIPLYLWFLLDALSNVGADYTGRRSWLAQPTTAILMIFFVSAGLYHMRLGIQVVIEDYIHTEATKIALLALNALLTFGLGIATLFAILKIALGV